MYIVPQPVSMKIKEGNFMLSGDTYIVLDAKCSQEDLNPAFLLRGEVKKLLGYNLAITKSSKPLEGCIYLKRDTKDGEAYSLSVSESIIVVQGSSAGLFYGVQTLRQILRNFPVTIPCMEIEDSPYFAHRGFYHDVTRGKVPTIDTLKELADRLSFYKVNQMQLYIEHTFAFRNMSEVWSITDPLTPEDILELDVYCTKRHIELVPSLSTFGHLYHVLTTNSFSKLCEIEGSRHEEYSWVKRQIHHTLDVSNPDSLKLVEKMLDEFIPLFSSDKFNICCDETFDLGEGKNKASAEKYGKGRLYVDFLNKIINIAEGHGKKVMFWGDIILKHPELLNEIPKDVTCLNWNYDADSREEDTKTISESNIPQYVCPGVCGWNHLMNDMDTASANITKMVTYGKKYGAVGVLNTDWGDFGHINLLANSIPGMIYGASLSWNPESAGEIDKADEASSFIEFGDKTASIVGLLRELSRQQTAPWGGIILWEERKYRNINLIANLDEMILKNSPEEIRESYNKAVEIGQKLLEIAATVPEDKKKDFREFYVSARGISLFEALHLIIQKYDFKHEIKDELVSPIELAERLEYWLLDYCSVWRERNKESELYRIKDTIFEICDYLRNI